MRRLDGEAYETLQHADRIEITGISASGVHGVYDDEAVDAQPFVIDVVLWTDVSEAVATDRLETTIDYVAASGLVQQVVGSSRALLIERLGEELCEAMLANPLALAARITVHKPRGARDAKAQDVCITVTRAR